jgi:hypothetical protein
MTGVEKIVALNFNLVSLFWFEVDWLKYVKKFIENWNAILVWTQFYFLKHIFVKLTGP